MSLGVVFAKSAPSVMFSAAEQAALQEALAIAEKVPTAQTDVSMQDAAPASTTATYLSLDAILHMSPSQWTIWINGQAYRAGEATHPPQTEILAVFPDHVTLTLNGVKHDIYLHCTIALPSEPPLS